jgi:hypothetical protein
MGGATSPAWLRRLPADDALNLAVFRVAVAALFLVTAEVHRAAAWATLPEALAVAPRGWGWALALWPPSLRAAQVAYVVVVAAALFGLVGRWTRAAFATLTLASLFLLALPLRAGLPFHYHHLVWFAALCAASPCADALSWDAWRRARSGAPPPERSPGYGVPLRVAWLLVGAIFFFPGTWKLRASGLAWITSDNLRNQLYWKWATVPALVPPFRVDHAPWLLHAGAAAVVALELSFAFAVWSRRLRLAAVAAALAFHLVARLFMGIDFSGLWLTYVVFVDWAALWRRWRGREAPPTEAAPRAARVAPALVVGAVLVAGAVDAGLRGATTAWPFACYPTFQERAGTVMPALALAFVDADGAERPFDPLAAVAPSSAPRERALGLSLLAASRTPDAANRFAGYLRHLREVASVDARDARAVRFYAARISTIPEERAQPPRALVPIFELPIEPTPAQPETRMPRARSGSTTSRASDDAASDR